MTEAKTGTAKRIITPPLGLEMAGWANRAAGDNIAHYVHDDIHVRALCAEANAKGWILLSADVSSIDPVTTEQIRSGISKRCELAPDAIMVCGTHCHSAPALSPVAVACSNEDLEQQSIQANGVLKYSFRVDTVTPGVGYADSLDRTWQQMFIDRSIEAGVSAWESRQSCRISYGESRIEGVGSSRRVILKDGSFADPRQVISEETEVVSRTTIDPTVRCIFFQNPDQTGVRSVLVNYGSHPWLFSISGISAELSGAVCEKTRKELPGNPDTIYTTGPEGDVTTIWNLDCDNLWKARPGETLEQSLSRREKVFDSELDRLAEIMVKGVRTAFETSVPTDPLNKPDVRAIRREVSLPLKPGYAHVPEVPLADWQKHAPHGRHLTEIQLLRLGDIAILGLPGEPFTAISDVIRRECNAPKLIMNALANDGGTLTYIPDAQAFRDGGYEVAICTLDSAAGEELVNASTGILAMKRAAQ